jgi:tetratricopeptide (TPR) repeat protein
MALEAQKNIDGALKVFHELANMDVANFSALGLYHQARILKGQGKTEDALKQLDKAGEKLATLKETPAAIKYVGGSVIELTETLDPKKARELTQKLMSSEAAKKMAETAAGPSGQKLSPELQRKIQEMMQKQSQPATPGGPMPGPVAPPPDAPPTDAPPPDAPAPGSVPSGAP